MSARAVKLIATPAANATLTQPVVRVQVRALAGAKTRIELGRANITKRFRRAGGTLVAHLRIRPGVNHLFVLAERKRRRAVADSHTFYLLRRNNRFVTVRVRRTRPYTAQVDVANPTARTVARRLAAVRRERRVRMSLNGRPVDRAASAPQRTRYTLEFSASQGLRFGVNRLTVRVVEPGAARYAVVKRRFVVPRDGPLAGAGWDRAARPHGRVLLGSSARAARGGKLSYRWTLVSRPSGSRARLRGERSARPLLIPDSPGHYLVRQAVTERGAGAGSASVDQVGVTVSAQPALLALSTNSEAYNPRGIQIGSTYYPHNGPGATIQWLMLDRATLQPVKTGNSWCCDNAAHSLENLSSVLGCAGGNGSAGLDQLLIITIPPGRVTLFPDQYGEFNAALQAIGVNPLPTALLNDGSQSLTIVGIPCAGAGSGWVLRRGGGSARMPQQGWLMPDGSLESTTGAPLYRLQPQRLAFNTRAASSTNTNRMTFAGQSASVSITPGEGGFQVVEIDPRDLSIAANNAYAVTSSNPGPAVNAMAAELNAARQRGNYVAVQSIGNVRPDYYQWWNIGDALIAMGANPDLFNRINGGSYAFFGGPPLSDSEVMQSASTVVVDPTTSPPTTEPGALSGRARQRPDGFYVPIASTAAATGQSLYDIVFKPSTPWPYTAAAGEPNAAAYRLALAYITSKLPDLAPWAPDLRQAYLGNPTLHYSDSKTDLAGVGYPGDKQTCSENPGQHPSNPGYTRTQFCNLVAELQLEFDWLDSTRTLFQSYETAMGRSGAQQGADLRTAGQQISKAVDPQRSGLAAPILYLLQSIAEVGAEFLGGPEIAPEVGLIATSYDLGSAAATSSGAPVSQQISGRVDQLADDIATNVANSANGLDGVRAVAISDYGRLKALAAVATAAKDLRITNLAKNLTTGADAYFATQLMPLGFYMWRLEPNSSNTDPQPGNCLIAGYINPPFQNIQNSAWQHVYRYYDSYQHYQSLILNDGYYRAGYPPPQTLTHTMFSPLSQRGYGIEKSSWFWAFPNKTSEPNCD